jgi:hypothetical protein
MDLPKQLKEKLNSKKIYKTNGRNFGMRFKSVDP